MRSFTAAIRIPGIVCGSVAVLMAAPAVAGPEDNTQQQEVIEVWGQPGSIDGEVVVVDDDTAPVPAANLGELLLALPGVSAVRRSATSIDPVIRGLGRERVSTKLGVVPLYGACPSRMDPPVAQIASNGFTSVTVDRGYSTVTAGPGATAGRIEVSPDFERPAGTASEVSGIVGASYESARNGAGTNASVQGGGASYDVRGTAELVQYDDYHSADGTLVPAGMNRSSGSLSLGVRPAENHRVWSALSYTHETDVDFPSLPMDNERSDVWIYNAGYRVLRPSGSLRRIELRTGLSSVDHQMSNANKPNRGMLVAVTPSRTWTFGSNLALVLRPGGDTTVRSGADWFLVSRDATRTRQMVDSGQSFYDHVWPDATQWDAGLYAEVERPLAATVSVRAGVRGDVLVSDAAGADGSSLAGMSVREHYAAFYGDDALTVGRTEATGAGILSLRWQPRHDVSGHVATGYSMRGAGINERYFAFAPAAGGYLIGNPSLAAEKKWESTIGAAVHRRWLRGAVTAHASRVGDYVMPMVVARQDVNGDGTDDTVRGYRNVRAWLAGAEANLTADLAGYPLQLSLSAAYVRGWNRTDGRDLPEIPALEGSAMVRAHSGDAVSPWWWFDLGARFAARQSFVDEAYPENETPGFATLYLRAGLDLPRYLRVELGADNLLDADYHEHLTREAAMPVGDLMAGAEIPAPGRSLFVTLSRRL